MRTHLKCIDCCIRSFIDTLHGIDADRDILETITRELLTFLAEMDYTRTPPYIARYLQQRLKFHFNIDDLFAEIKTRYNREMLENYDLFKNKIRNSGDRLTAALKLAISGNIIDFGPNERFNIEDTIEGALHRELTVDHSSGLFNEIKNAGSVLYLADNAGEIVADRLFIETLIETGTVLPENVTVAVRGGPIQNDVTLDDARDIGLDKLVRVISNGDRSPGTILEYVSDEFREIFEKADLIISKGQGNYETLFGETDRNIFFLLIAKCSLVADELGVPLYSFVCRGPKQ
jgi:hypothetical protein